MLAELTKKQQNVLKFIKNQINGRGFPPTVREIGEEFDINSPNGVMCHLRALEKKGHITRGANFSRAIQLTDEVKEAETGLPLAGLVAAGTMHEAFEQDERIDFGSMFAKKSQFVLEVTGDSMIEAHIQDGDYVVVTKQRTAQPGQMVVAQTEEGEATLKYWFPEKSKKRIRLQPANKKMKPIYVKDAKVLGVISGVVRKV
jgi:repressor LexA